MPIFKVIRRKKTRTIFELSDGDLIWLKEECNFGHSMAKRLLYEREWVRRWREFFKLRKDIDKPGAYMQKYGAVRQGQSTGLEPPAVVRTKSGDKKLGKTWRQWATTIKNTSEPHELDRISADALTENTEASRDAARAAYHKAARIRAGFDEKAGRMQKASDILAEILG